MSAQGSVRESGVGISAHHVKEKKMKKEKKDPSPSSSSPPSEPNSLTDGYFTSKGTFHAFKKSESKLSAKEKAILAVPDLKEWDPSAVTPESTMVFLGKRRSGKSVGVRNLMYQLKDQVQNVLVISQTEKVNDYYQKMVPEVFVHGIYNPFVLNKLFERQSALKAKAEAELKEKGQEGKEGGKVDFENVMVILDDVISNPLIRNDPTLIKCFTEGRHFHLVVMLVSQYPRALNPRVRGNTDFCFIFRTLSRMQIDSLYEDYAGNLTRDVFAAMIDKYTDGFGCVVVDMRTNSQDPTEIFYKYTFPDPEKFPPEFKMGEEKYWEESRIEHQRKLNDMLRQSSDFQELTTKHFDISAIVKKVTDSILN